MVFLGPLAVTLLPPSLTLLVFHLSSSQDVVTEPSSEQQLCTLREHPTVAFADLKPWVFNFTYPGARDFSQLALDPSRNQLIVGARNYLFRLSLANVSLLQATEWASNEDTRRSCQSKGKTEEECQNYVRVLIVTGRKVFMCGTNAFSPVCSSRQVGNLSRTIEKINGVARCPYDPRHNSTAVISSQGELYAATVIDFSGRDPAIYRSLGSGPPLRTAQYNSKWLNEPNFVAAYDIGLFAYFFLRENAVEHDCGRTVYSRVARVCKNDVGGRFLLEDTWTTFMKARLNCSRPGEVPFYYNELQSAFHLPEQDLIYGVFTTNVNSIAASAVCAFNLSAISQAFNGPFRSQENPRAAWLPIANPIPNFQCGTLPEVGPNENLTERSLQDAQRLFLMSEAVQPVTPEPCVTQDSVRFSHLVVDLVQAKDTLYHVLYIGTESGTILKALSTTSRSLRGCYLEELHVLPPGRREPLRSLRILHSARALFVGLSDGVLRVPLERCAAYRSQGACLGARDPYCGWDGKQQRCSTLEDSSNMSLWTQNITTCPVRNVTQDGGFGQWSPWQPCEHLDGDNSGSCLCRARACDSPRPRCGGRDCLGPAIHIANCSRNGAWTPWSSWALCSTSCGIGFQVRQRSCSNPAPRHGGRICVGKSREERFCNENTPCPVPIFWASWGSWSKCSSNCGGGVQSRRRSCENGNSCPGCGVEFKTCNPEGCPEVRRNTPWTPWLPVNVTQGGARQEQRFRFTCRAPLPDPHGLQFGRRRTETRTCPADGSGACDTDGTAPRGPFPPRLRVLARGWGRPGSGGAPGGESRGLEGARRTVCGEGVGAAGCPVAEASLPTRAPPSPGGGSPAQRGHFPALCERGLGRVGPLVVLLPGLRAGLPCPQENVHEPGAPQRRPAMRGRRCRVPGLQSPGLSSAGCLVLLDFMVPMLSVLWWRPLSTNTFLHQPRALPGRGHLSWSAHRGGAVCYTGLPRRLVTVV
uniref:Sema domain-containing protein n=1 Tax=Felis catus TaxID=9685 RepID=A0ABI7XLJ7_FELCA